MIKTYLDLGWHLFPLKHGGKTPLTPNGFKDATNNPHEIADWAKEESNWGISTGPSSLIVVDFDVHKGGTREAFEAIYGKLVDTVEARTGSGGTHLYYRNPGVFVKTRLGFIKGVDVLGATGYVVAPPSLHPNGKHYEWVNSPLTCAVAEAPQNLLDALQKSQDSRPKNVVEIYGKAKEVYYAAGDGRWAHLQRFAGALRSLGWGKPAITDALLSFYHNQCEPAEGYEAKIRSLANWVVTRPPINTRQDEGEAFVAYQGSVLKISRKELAEYLRKGAKVCSK